MLIGFNVLLFIGFLINTISTEWYHVYKKEDGKMRKNFIRVSVSIFINVFWTIETDFMMVSLSA